MLKMKNKKIYIILGFIIISILAAITIYFCFFSKKEEALTSDLTTLNAQIDLYFEKPNESIVVYFNIPYHAAQFINNTGTYAYSLDENILLLFEKKKEEDSWELYSYEEIDFVRSDISLLYSKFDTMIDTKNQDKSQQVTVSLNAAQSTDIKGYLIIMASKDYENQIQENWTCNITLNNNYIETVECFEKENIVARINFGMFNNVDKNQLFRFSIKKEDFKTLEEYKKNKS